jgi:dTDP-4-amino-4,6-dideoxy-D-galactose acyltransferase
VDNLCQFLNWDSDFFGYRIARVGPNRLNSGTIEEILKWCKANHIDCLYFLAEADDPDTVNLAEDNSFRFVDIRLTLDKTLEQNPAAGENDAQSIIRPFTPEDVPTLRAIAKASHQDSRFYFDSNFPASRCDALYEMWIEKSCYGYADAVLVADIKGQAVGYISCHLTSQNQGEIGLMGVAANRQGMGLGQKLVNGSLNWFVSQGVTHISVVTQGRNSQAQRLYQRCGFLTRRIQLWYHRWFVSKEI